MPGIALARSRTLQCFGQFALHRRKIALNPARTPDQDMVGIGETMLRQHRTQHFAKAPLHPVAHHGIADLFSDGDTIARALIRVGPRLQDKAGPRIAQAFIGSQKIAAFGEDFEHWLSISSKFSANPALVLGERMAALGKNI